MKTEAPYVENQAPKPADEISSGLLPHKKSLDSS